MYWPAYATGTGNNWKTLNVDPAGILPGTPTAIACANSFGVFVVVNGQLYRWNPTVIDDWSTGAWSQVNIPASSSMPDNIKSFVVSDPPRSWTAVSGLLWAADANGKFWGTGQWVSPATWTSWTEFQQPPPFGGSYNIRGLSGGGGDLGIGLVAINIEDSMPMSWESTGFVPMQNPASPQPQMNVITCDGMGWPFAFSNGNQYLQQYN